MSRNPYCSKCGIVFHVHSTVYCARVEDLLVKGERLLERVQSLREELDESKTEIERLKDTFAKDKMRYSKMLDRVVDVGIYPDRITGGNNAYEKRTEWMEGWNDCASEVISRHEKACMDDGELESHFEMTVEDRVSEETASLSRKLRETVKELTEAKAIIANTAATVQAFRLFIPPKGVPPENRQNLNRAR